VCRELAKNARDAFELTVFDLAPLALLGAPPERATTVSLHDYDFAAARLRLAARVDAETRTVRDGRGEYDFERTRNLRELEDGVDDVVCLRELIKLESFSSARALLAEVYERQLALLAVHAAARQEEG
jgi:hypothetical protein